MVPVDVHDFIAEGTVELGVEDWGSHPPLDHAFVKERRGDLLEGSTWRSVQPLTRPAGAGEVEVRAATVVGVIGGALL